MASHRIGARVAGLSPAQLCAIIEAPAEESGGGGGAHIISLLAGVLPSRLAALFLPPAAR